MTLQTDLVHQPMSGKRKEIESPTATLKDEFTRQRWDLFHRAIAHAKQSNDDALRDADGSGGDAATTAPHLTVVR